MDRVTVYRFKLSDADSDPENLAPRAATAEAIRQIMDAEPVFESAQVVDAHCLDSRGFLVDGCS
jgi:hypothetical protein